MVLRTILSLLLSGFCDRATPAGHSSSGYRFTDRAGWALISLALILIAGCDILDIDVYVEIEPRESTLIAGESTKFTATVYGGYEGLEWKIVWQVEPASLGEFDGSGYFQATGVGEGLVTASVANVSYKGEAAAKVSVVPKTVTVSPANISLVVGESFQFVAEATNIHNEVIDPKRASVQWSLDNPALGSINDRGRLRTTGPGAGSVVAEAGDKKASATVVVYRGRISSNLVRNGDFAQPWDTGWERQIGDIKKGANVVNTVDGRIYMRHEGEDYQLLVQFVDVPSSNLRFVISFKMVVQRSQGLWHFFSSGYAYAGIVFRDENENVLGGVYLFNSEESIAAGLPGTITYPEGSNTFHYIKVEDAKWYEDYIISTQEEIRGYLPGVDAERISQVAIILYTGASHPGAKGELFADNIQLYSIERQ